MLWRIYLKQFSILLTVTYQGPDNKNLVCFSSKHFPTLSAMDNAENSELNNPSVDENTRDYGFIKDLLRYVLLECYPKIKWEPTAIFAEECLDSPFKEIMKSAVKIHLENNRDHIRFDYNLDFPCKENICNKSHMDNISCQRVVFENKLFENASFLDFMCRCAEYTMLSYKNGVQSAPRTTLEVISTMMRTMRNSDGLSANVWKDFEDFCESYVQADEEKKKHGKSKRQGKKMTCTV